MRNYGAMPPHQEREGSDRVVFARFNLELQSNDLQALLTYL